jgi:uncharacterized membrane protein
MGLRDSVIHGIERQTWIDGVADPVQTVVREALYRAPGLAKVLHGRFLGHPLHAALVAIPVGAFSIGIALDVTGLATGARRLEKTADLLTGIGLGGAVVAATAGLADWSLTEGPTKRVGFVHMTMNLGILGVYGLSVLERTRHNRGAALALAATGYGALAFSAWLGGELAYRFGVGVSVRPEAPKPPTPDVAPEVRTRVG